MKALALLSLASMFINTAGRAATGTVVVEFGLDRYQIPRGYLVSAGKSASQPGVSAVGLIMLLPNLEPRTSANSRKFFWTDPKGQLFGGTSDILRASISYIPHLHLRQVDTVVAEGIASLGLKPNEFVQFAPGIRLYHRPGYEELYAADSAANGPRYWHCNASDGRDPPPNPTCSIVEQWTPTLMVTVYFDKRYVKQTVAIDRHLRLLIASFKTASSP